MKPKLMTHLVAFYPDRDLCLSVAKALIDGGSSYLEFQFPFSDPIADGTYIQRACYKALDQGFKISKGFELLNIIRGITDIPIFVMSYGNLIYSRGIERFLKECKKAGVQGVIIPDLPPDYDEGLYSTGKKLGIDVVPVISPIINNERLELISKTGAKYLYTSLRKGITGAFTEIGKENIEFIKRLKPLGMKILAGFGISEKKQIELLSPHVHAVVIGSAFIKEIINNGENKNPYNAILNKMKMLV